MFENKSCDEWLMAEVGRGKREALEPLVRRHATPLLTFIHRMVGDRQHSEEVFQDVFLAVWTKGWQYEYPRPFKSWLYAIAVNKCHAAVRHAPRSPPCSIENLAPLDLQAPDASPAETAIATETAAAVAEAVTLLPPRQRAVVVLRIWQQLSYLEIADILGTTEATARAHMHHGLGAMRKYLEPRLG
jgi:RNA polymerase sigma-70 factor (ECF subfamily)